MSITITLSSIAITTMWVVGVVLAVLDVIYPPPLTALSMGFMIGAGTLSVRKCINRYAANWETAYGAGREVAKVRQMR